MSDKKFTVEVAYTEGHDTRLMAKAEIIEMVTENENTWVFIDSKMVEIEDLESIDLNDADEIRINPGMVGGAESFTVMVTDNSGHSEVEMTLDKLKSEAEVSTNWVFINHKLVNVSNLEDEISSVKKDINEGKEETLKIRLTPQIVAGLERFIVETTNDKGHMQQALTKQEISNLATTDHWVFLDGQLVSAEIIESTQFNQDIHVRYVRPLVGGV